MRTDMLLHLHANPLQIEPHLLQHIDFYALFEFDPSEQQVFSSHLVVVEPLGLLARKHQDLLRTWSKIIHYCVPLPDPLTLLKVDTTSSFQHLTSKPKEIEYCNEYQSSVLRAGNLTAEPEVNYSPKGTAVVSASIANNESYGSADYGVGRSSLRNRASLP